MSDPSPAPEPRGLLRVVLRWAAGDDVDALLGDLREEYETIRRGTAGDSHAKRWYWRQLIGSLTPLALRRVGRALSEATTRRGDGTMGDLIQDLGYALRTLRKNAGFAAVIVGMLSLGIGANTIIYSAVDGLVLHPFPFPDGDRLVAVGTQYPRLGATQLGFVEHMSPAEYVDLRDEAESLERVVAWDMGNRQVSFGEVTENVFTGFWWGDAFQTIDMPPHLGRGMTWEESVGGAPVAVLSHRLWSTAFGGDESLVGSVIMMNGNPFTVIGIMPPGAIMYGMDLWIPMGVDPSVFPRNRRQFQVIARIADGYTLEQVNTQLEGLARRTEMAYAADFEEYADWRLEADTWTGANVRTLRPAAFVLLGAVGFVLLLVCTNVASLLLARSATRRKEMALRRALGAGRARLVRQVLTESVTLAAVGGLLGVGVAWIGVQRLAEIVSTIPFVSGGVVLNVRVLAFTAMTSVLAGIAFGIVPAFQGAEGGTQSALRSDSGAATSRGSRLRLQRVFVGVEVALALVLLASGGLFLNSVMRMNRIDPGFAADELLTMRLTLPWEEYDGPAIGAFFQELEERVAALPGVQRVGVGSQFPPVAFSYLRVATEAQAALEEGQLPTAMATLVSPGYFDALGIPLNRGRGFSDLDVEGSPMVGVINEAAATLLFPDSDPVGQRITAGDADLEVIGVVANTLNQGIDQPPFPELFANHRQVPGWSNQLFLLARTTGEPLGLLPAIRQEVLAMDPDQPVYLIRTADEALVQATASRRLAARLLSVFAAFALTLAAGGIFAVVSFAVGDRTREIGVRVALGADAGVVRRLMVGQTFVPIVIGALFGIAGAVAVGRALEGLLFEVSGTDVPTLAGVLVVLVATAVLASYLPARRAARLDPVQALRQE